MVRQAIQKLLSQLVTRLHKPLLDDLRAQQKRFAEQLKETEERLSVSLRRTTEKTDAKASRERQRLDDGLRDLNYQQAEIRLELQRVGRVGARRGRRRSQPSCVVPPSRAAAGGSLVPSDSIVELAACPVCGCSEFTPVCEYNKFLVIDSDLVDEAAAFYDYSLCHKCGVVFARCRPAGRRYEYLLDRFEVAVGRSQDGTPLGAAKAAISSGALTDADRDALRERIAQGVFVSDHLGIAKRDHVPALLRDRLATAVHVEVLGSLLSLSRPRVLELRPRVGSIGAALERLYGADVYAMPLFEGQQFLVEEAYGFPADHLVKYDRFTIPYDGQFDLIVANHMLTHVLQPREFFAIVKSRLKPGGHLYLYNEPDESDFLAEDKSIINRLNAFHVQVFNGPSLTRALAAGGFEPVFVTSHEHHVIALVRAASADVQWLPMPARERERRRDAYHAARDLALLKLPEPVRERLAGTRQEIMDRLFGSRAR